MALQYYMQRYGGNKLGFGGQVELIRQLAEVLARTSSSPLHFAAALGLPGLCRALVERDSELCRALVERHGANVDEHHPLGLGTPLFCALIGPPRIFERATGDKEASQIWASLHEYPSSVNQRATIEFLMEYGVDDAAAEERSRPILSLASTALLTCIRLDDAHLYIKLVQAGVDIDQNVVDILSQVNLGYTPPTALLSSKTRRCPRPGKHVSRRYVDTSSTRPWTA